MDRGSLRIAYFARRPSARCQPSLVRGRLLNVIDNDNFDRAFSRLQFEADPLYGLENRGAFIRLAFVYVEIQVDVVQSRQSSPVDYRFSDRALKGGCQRFH